MENKPVKPRSTRVAYHEAGHAVVGWRLRVPLVRRGIAIVPDGKAQGCVYHRRFVGRDIEYDHSDRYRRRVERYVQICQAGEISQRIYCPSSIRASELVADRSDAMGMLLRVAGHREAEAWEKLLLIRTEELLADSNVWRAVERLATALIERKKLSGPEATEIMRAGFNERLTRLLQEQAASGELAQAPA